MGLSICRELVHEFGGSIDIESELGLGTDFIVRVPSKCKVDPLIVDIERLDGRETNLR